jgi:2-polyprenyl-3-methyl-5-hydroxy-6-metoxy-1,4-benzoquinol methylase
MCDVTACGICGHHEFINIIDLGDQPLAERESESYPLSLIQCVNCSLVQLSYMVDNTEVFPKNHPYTTGNTAALRDHFAFLAKRLSFFLRPDDLVVDIGANDGTLLELVRDNRSDVRVHAVEPTNQATKCRAKNIPVDQEFFTRKLGMKMYEYFGAAKIITATNVLAHVPDPHDFMSGVYELLSSDGLFITENHDWSSIEYGLQIDTIYHEHLRYYSIASLSYLLSVHDFNIVDVEKIRTHGGSFRVYARKVPARSLEERAGKVRDKLDKLLDRLTGDGNTIYGIGATTRATPLIHYAGLGASIDCVCEVAGSEKIGQNIPGTVIPIVDEQCLFDDQPEYALLLSWHIADSIMPKLRARGYTGKFIIPLPEPRIVDG